MTISFIIEIIIFQKFYLIDRIVSTYIIGVRKFYFGKITPKSLKNKTTKMTLYNLLFLIIHLIED